MTIPLLITKLYIPPARPDLVSRPRLVERLEEGLRLGCKLTLVSAPAGFGKTTLLSEWIAGSGMHAQVAWVSLDEGDNDVARFWSYSIAALQTLEPAIGQTALGALQAAQTPSLEPLLISLVNDISSLVVGKRPFILVLDDYHVIGPKRSTRAWTICSIIYRLTCAWSSPREKILRWPYLSCRGRGQLTRYAQADLRFTPAETAEFLNTVMGLELSQQDIAALESRTEGWVVGLQMAALSLRGQTDPEVHDFVSAFTGDDRYITDYLLDQVLHRQAPYIQRFLIRPRSLTGYVGHCAMPCWQSARSARTCRLTRRFRLATGIGASRTRGLFVIPLDNRRHWYRYHHLFADLLRSRLQAVSEPLSTVEGGK